MNFDATIEIVTTHRAIISLFHNGEWSGSGSIDVRSGSRRTLYEQGYIHACARAACKGGNLQTYREVS